MVVELEYISQYPIPDHATGINARIPQRVFQKKLFVIENLQIEEHVNSKGLVVKKFATAKYDNEFYKINIPYQKLKEMYFSQNPINGFNHA